ncbi:MULTISPECIES: type IV secretory system conjugative DNA transfer family protein [Hydrocarboniphaga]|uniref:type IV secretory system conjugative DNA transfer family protein n=1 Tax=Hydrocarboniphaga TaxID=243627 RepID=UPI002AB9B67B|nr:type IV secretory system conjugative DNA transfer family protein [Hydrocarboniphaga sp.]MDZ4078517.1 type IV secretory system conjugative DNA transfer family protein [Hydrocarboniphaga sp.]
MRYSWKDLIPALLLLIAAPWLAGMFFAAFVGARNYMPGYLEYLQMWRTYSPSPHYRSLLQLAAGLPVVLGAMFALLPVLARRPALFGDAHFADESEVRAAGLRARSGVVLGRLRGRLLRARGQLGVLLFAPPRSGKGVGFVIPNLLTWHGSAIVNDLKLENFEKTSGAREAMGQQIVLFAPLDTEGRTHAYNPLDFVSTDRNLRVNDVQAITAKLVTTPPRADPMWTNEARVLLDGLILFLLDVNRRASLGAVYRAVLSTPNFADYLTWAMKEYEGKLDPVAVMQFNGFLGKAFKEQSGVLSSLKAALSLFANPLVDRATSITDFDPRELRRRTMTIYLGVMPRDIARLSPLLNIFVQQTFDGLLGRLPGKDEPHQVLALLDEFTALGRLENVERGIAYFAGYNIILAPVIQDLSQLEEVYGQAVTETFLSTANIRIAYAQNSLKTAKYLSEEMGFRTITTKSRSRHVNDPWHGHVSESQTRRELMLPHEIRELDRRRELLLVEAAPPVKADKIRYYDDRAFTRLLRPAPARPKLHNAIVEPPQMPAAGPALTNEEIDEVLGAVRTVPIGGRTE